MTSAEEVCKLLAKPIKHLVTLDWETYYDKEYSLRKMTADNYIRDPRFETIGVSVKIDGQPSKWLEKAEFRIWADEWDLWEYTAVLAHNAAFDCFILHHHYGVLPAMIFDTLSMARPLHGVEVGGSLAKLSLFYGVGEKGHEVENVVGMHRADFTKEAWDRYGAYSRNDADLAHKLFYKMLPGFPEMELQLIDLTVRFFVDPALVLDEPALKDYLAYEQKRKADLLARVAKAHECAQEDAKPLLMSNPKFATLLEEYGVEPPKKISPTTGELAFAFAKSDPGMQALLEDSNEDVRLLAEARIGVKSTINETRTQRFIKMGEGGRAAPVMLKYWGAHTGRWSGAGGVNWQNLQRVNKKDPNSGMLRKATLAPEGHVVVVADSGQIEVRVLQWLAGNSVALDQFRRNDEKTRIYKETGVGEEGDYYSEAGSPIFGMQLSKDKTPNERQNAKGILLGSGFQMGWPRCASELLKGLLGTPPVQYRIADAEKYGVNVVKFINHAPRGMPSNRVRVEGIQSRLSFDDLAIHCAVTDHMIKQYRSVNLPVTDFWTACLDILEMMESFSEGQAVAFGPGGCMKVLRHAIQLPGSHKLRYPGLENHAGDFSYLGGDGYAKTRTHIYGGKLTENLVQALARLVVAEQMLWCAADGIAVRSCTHDEIIATAPEAEGASTLKQMVSRMRTPPSWCADIPLMAEGGAHRSYGSAK